MARTLIGLGSIMKFVLNIALTYMTHLLFENFMWCIVETCCAAACFKTEHRSLLYVVWVRSKILSLQGRKTFEDRVKRQNGQNLNFKFQMIVALFVRLKLTAKIRQNKWKSPSLFHSFIWLLVKRYAHFNYKLILVL